MNKGIKTAVEITGTHIKVAQVKSDYLGAAVTALRHKEIASQSDEAISNSLKELFAQNKIKPTRVLCVIPRRFAILRTLKLPSHDDLEIRKMLQLQATKQIPYPKEDIIIDYTVVAKETGGYSRVLLAIVHKDVAFRYLTMFQKAGIEIEKIVLSSQGVCSWYNFFQPKGALGEKEIAVLIDVDTDTTDICFYGNKHLFFSRAISFGTKDTSDEKMRDFLEQVRLTISAYNKEKIDYSIAKIVLLSGSENLTDAARGLEEELAITTETVNVSQCMAGTKKLSLPPSMDTNTVSSVVILGQSLQGEKDQLNFMPLSIYQDKKDKIIKKELITAALLFLGCVFLVFTAAFVKLYQDEQHLKNLEISLRDTTPEAEKLRTAISKLNLIKQRLDPTYSSIDIIHELYDLLPEGMGINIFNLDESNAFTLQGVSLAMSEVFKFQSLLEESPRFQNVEVKYASKRRIRGGEVTDFRISCQVVKILQSK
ncbi:pilus assembly protein PilM [Candidatus Omnitrophota bacterium]